MVSPSSASFFSIPIRTYLQLFRWPAAVIAAIAGCAALAAVNLNVSLTDYGLTAYCLAAMNAAACAINDYWDIDADRIDHPERPLPAGRLSPAQAYQAAAILFATALLAALLLGWAPFLLTVCCTIALWYYSQLLRYSGILGNFVVAFTIAAILFFGSLVGQRPLALLYPTVFLFGLAFAKEIVWDIHDAAGDRSAAILTVADHWSDRMAFSLAWIVCGGLLLSVPLALQTLAMSHPALFSTCTLLMLAIWAWSLAQFQLRRTQTTYRHLVAWGRISMLVGSLGLLGAAAPCC
ncbi:MAG: UbiA family prenyltransferase [Leptolyngbya sp. SIO4C1]|nr:UbiA family prenyltransferase [Leptolyngbya sp. SIO4C1]